MLKKNIVKIYLLIIIIQIEIINQGIKYFLKILLKLIQINKQTANINFMEH